MNRDFRRLLPHCHSATEQRLILSHITKNSRMALVRGVDHVLETECPSSFATSVAEDAGYVTFAVEAHPGQPLSPTKYAMARYTFRERGNPIGVGTSPR